MRGPFWTRLAAATGIEFVAAVAAVAIIGELKDFPNASAYALEASNEVFGTTALLTGFAAIALFWFAGTLAARLRQLEGGSGRLAAAVNGSGAVISGLLVLGVGVLFAARSGGSADLGALAATIYDGPTLMFPAAVFVGAAGVVGYRAAGLPVYSRVVSRLSIPLAAAFFGGAGLMLFKNYAWINDTAEITFGAWVLILSIIGIRRWAEMDEAPAVPRARVVPAAPPPAAAPAETAEIGVAPVRKPRPRPRPRAKKAAPRKRPPRTPRTPRTPPPEEPEV